MTSSWERARRTVLDDAAAGTPLQVLLQRASCWGPAGPPVPILRRGGALIALVRFDERARAGSDCRARRERNDQSMTTGRQSCKDCCSPPLPDRCRCKRCQKAHNERETERRAERRKQEKCWVCGENVARVKRKNGTYRKLQTCETHRGYFQRRANPPPARRKVKAKGAHA